MKIPVPEIEFLMEKYKMPVSMLERVQRNLMNKKKIEK